MFGARVWRAGVRALTLGYRPGKIIGDPWMMPGLLLVEGERIVWLHSFRHAGDHPPMECLPRNMEEAKARRLNLRQVPV